MPIKISFSDLTHTGQSISANTVPLGVAFVASYAKAKFGDEIECEIFRYPEDFSYYLNKKTPKIACFSCFSWNLSLSHKYAKYIKEYSKETIIVFGGLNFPLVKEEQHDFLIRHSSIDFYIEGEGEFAFVGLIEALKAVEFNLDKFKRSGIVVPNVRYLANDQMIAGKMLPRIDNLNIIPSPYENGMCDKFFDEKLTPAIQTARGCPYSCTFCNIGSRHWSKVQRFSLDRIKREINYISDRVKVPELTICDDNFGMVKEDIYTSQHLAEKQEKMNWPKYISVGTAKNHKANIIEISSILRGRLNAGASVQSTDPKVLKRIKRKNLPIEDLAELSKSRVSEDINSFSEVILALPEDTKITHFKSIFDMIDEGFGILRSHQFMLLEGSEVAARQVREQFGMRILYHIQPRCFGFYSVYGKTFSVAEIEEVCVATNSMSYEEYKECRLLNLTVEIFNNDSIFYDLIQFLFLTGVSASEFIKGIHKHIIEDKGKIGRLYEEYQKEEERNFWNTTTFP